MRDLLSQLDSMELGGALTIFLALCLSCLLIMIAWKKVTKAGKLPPGPTPIPFLGNLLQVRTDATFQSFMKVSQPQPQKQTTTPKTQVPKETRPTLEF